MFSIIITQVPEFQRPFIQWVLQECVEDIVKPFHQSIPLLREEFSSHDSPPPGRSSPLMTPLLLGGGVRGGGDKHGHNIFYNRMVQFLIHPTPNPSPKGAGNCAGIRNVSE